MTLSQKQMNFLEKRRQLLKVWTYAGPSMLLLIIVLVVFLKINTPWLIDPFEVISRLEEGSVETSSLEMMAVLLPVMSCLVCFLLAAFVFLMYLVFTNEKKYLEILNQLQALDRRQ